MTTTLPRPIGTEYPERCQSCGLHPIAQGHRAPYCTPSGPLGLLLAREGRDTGMQRTVEAHPAAVSIIDSVILKRINDRRPFSANTIRAELVNLSPAERPAIGARMNALTRKHCRKLGEEPSTDPGTHGKTVAVWVSRAAA